MYLINISRTVLNLYFILDKLVWAILLFTDLGNNFPFPIYLLCLYVIDNMTI